MIDNHDMNGMHWVEWFYETFPDGKFPDKDTALGWFANAIMAGWDNGFQAGFRFEREAQAEDD